MLYVLLAAAVISTVCHLLMVEMPGCLLRHLMIV